MKKLYEDDSLTLHTDLYQINMMKTYWETGRADLHSVFECYPRPVCHLIMVMSSLPVLNDL